MNEITESIAAFREAARHLWNTFFFPNADWDDRDRYSEVCVHLFDAVRYHLDLTWPKTISATGGSLRAVPVTTTRALS